MHLLLVIFLTVLFLVLALFGAFLIVCFIPEIEAFIKIIKAKFKS